MHVIGRLAAVVVASTLAGCCCDTRRGNCCPPSTVAFAPTRPPVASAPVPLAPAPSVAPTGSEPAATPTSPSAPTPTPPPPAAPRAAPAAAPVPPPEPPSVDRSPQLAIGTFTVMYMISGTYTPVAWASRLSDGTEIWLLSPDFVMPSSSATNVTWTIQYQTSNTYGTCSDLYAWACSRPAYAPYVNGKAMRCLEHSTLETWNGSTVRSCP
jgi:hypothetical protein